MKKRQTEEWIKSLPDIVVQKEHDGSRYVYLDNRGSPVKSGVVIQLGFFRMWHILDMIDESKHKDKGIQKGLRNKKISIEEFNEIVNDHDLIPENHNSIIDIIYPMRHSLRLLQGLEKVLPFYNSKQYPTYTIERAIGNCLDGQTSFTHQYIARCIDYFILSCIQDHNYTGRLNFEKQIPIVRDMPKVSDIL